MRTTANIATVRAYEVRQEGLADAAKVLKNIVLFAAAPFIGLAYAAAFPFVAVGMLAWYGVRAARARAGRT
jgi:hypothetical protein